VIVIEHNLEVIKTATGSSISVPKAATVAANRGGWSARGDREGQEKLHGTLF